MSYWTCIGLAGIELGLSPLGAGINECLLVDPANALDRAYIEGVLTAKAARMGCFHLAMGYIIVLLLLESGNLRFGENFACLGNMTLQWQHARNCQARPQS